MIRHKILHVKACASIDIKYIDIAQNLTAQWEIMWDTVNFPEPEEKRANFTSNQKKEQYVHITHYIYSKWVYFKSTIALEHVWIKTNHLYHTQN